MTNKKTMEKGAGSAPPENMPPMGKPGIGKMDWKAAKRILTYLKDYKISLVVVVFEAPQNFV